VGLGNPSVLYPHNESCSIIFLIRLYLPQLETPVINVRISSEQLLTYHLSQ